MKWLKEFQKLAHEQATGVKNNATKLAEMAEQARVYWGQQNPSLETSEQKLMRNDVANAIRSVSQLPGIKQVVRRNV
jgi:hypothetical protein